MNFLPTMDTHAVVRTVVVCVNDNAFLWCVAHDHNPSVDHHPSVDLHGDAVVSVDWGRFVLGESRRKLSLVL